MAGLSLRSNTCPAKRPSLRACGAGVSFAGLGLSVYFTAIRGYFERPTLRGCTLRRTMAGLSLRSNACPAKRPSLRACIAGMGFGGLIYQHVQTAICGYFERPTLRGCIFAADCGRVGASPQRLSCQKTKPKGSWCRGGLWWFGFICVFTRLYADGFERPTLRGCIFVADYGRVVASLQRLPCQKTKPKGLCCGSELWWFGFICVFTRLLADILRDQP